MTIDISLDPTRLPRHIAIVMDGNGRWAQQRNKPRLYGHKVGAESVRDIVETARELEIEVLTLYAFSSENWKRPENEVKGLMSILKSFLVSELSRMLKNDIRLSCIGQIDKLPKDVVKILRDSMAKTVHNKKLILNLALSYGSKSEITRAVRRLAEKCTEGTITPADIDEQMVSAELYTAGLVDPDLLIRTGGEARLSNFLLWQASYAEIYFTKTMWPDFRKKVFLKAIKDYQMRERRFGKTGAQLVTSNGD